MTTMLSSPEQRGQCMPQEYQRALEGKALWWTSGVVEEVDSLVVRGLPLLVPRWLLQVVMTKMLSLLQTDFGLMVKVKTELTAGFENNRRKKGMISFRKNAQKMKSFL